MNRNETPGEDLERSRARQRVYDAAHREEKKAYAAAHYLAHREEMIATSSAYYAAHREETAVKQRASSAVYRIGHAEERKAYAAAYGAAHREEINAKAKAFYYAHREAIRARQAAYYANHPRLWLVQRLKSFYWMTPERYEALLARQQGLCAICGTVLDRGIDTQLDHNHACCPGRASCGQCVRGILCRACNRALGMFGDDPLRLERAAEYVREGQRSPG